MEKLLLVIICCLAVTDAISVDFKDCGSQLGKVLNVTVEPCKALPCQLERGSSYSIGISFIPQTSDKNIKAVVHGILEHIPVVFPLDQPNACVKSNLQCPLKENASYTYTASLPVKKEYPQVELVVEWELTDTDQGKDIACVEIPVAVVGSSIHRVKPLLGDW